MASLKDVAKYAGVSITTVSRVLKNDPSLNISNSTRENIITAANKLGYRTKKTSSGLKFAIVNWYNHEQEIIDPYYYYIRASAQKQCEKHGISTQILFKHDELSNLTNIDAIIAIGKFSETDIEKMSLYTENIVFVDYSPVNLKYDSVVNDFKEIMYYLVEMFNADGYENLAYIGGIEYVKNGEAIEDLRYLYFSKAAKQLNLYSKEYVFQGDFTSESGYKLTKKLLQKKIKLPMVIFCGNDIIAMGVNKAVHEAGYNIPSDISLFGFNDIEIAKYIHPSLSTVHVYMNEMGVEAIETALQRVKNPNTIHKKIVIPTKVIIRDSYIKRKEITL